MSRTPAHRYPRTARLNEVVLEVLADEVERLSDPRLGFVTLTGVEVATDLHEAVVFYSSIDPQGNDADDDAVAGTAAALDAAASHLRGVLGRQVRMRYVPRLVFRPDPAIAHGRRIETILREIHLREAGSGQAGDAGSEEAG